MEQVSEKAPAAAKAKLNEARLSSGGSAKRSTFFTATLKFNRRWQGELFEPGEQSWGGSCSEGVEPWCKLRLSQCLQQASRQPLLERTIPTLRMYMIGVRKSLFLRARRFTDSVPLDLDSTYLLYWLLSLKKSWATHQGNSTFSIFPGNPAIHHMADQWLSVPALQQVWFYHEKEIYNSITLFFCFVKLNY